MAAMTIVERPCGARGLSTEILLHRLRGLTALTWRETELILSLADQPKPHAPGTAICPDQQGAPHPRLIVSGWACRPRMLSDGRRQLLSLVLPGDLIGDRGAERPFALNPVVAITPVRTIGAGRLFGAVRDRPDDHPGLATALAVIERAEEAALLDHVVRLGVHSALQRVASLLLELYRRLAAIGFVHDGAYPMPLTQDMLGLSLVHVNRIVRQLRRDHLATIRGGVVTIHDFARLALLADQIDPIQAAITE